MSVEWTPELTLNHDELDHHHVELFRRLHEAVVALDRTRAELEGAVALFADSVVEHAGAEDRLMLDSLYPERVRHRSAHDLFIADLERLRAEVATAGATPLVAEWLRVRVPEWLHFHIRVNDAPLALYLARRGSHAVEGRPGRTVGQRPS